MDIRVQWHECHIEISLISLYDLENVSYQYDIFGCCTETFCILSRCSICVFMTIIKISHLNIASLLTIKNKQASFNLLTKRFILWYS